MLHKRNYLSSLLFFFLVVFLFSGCDVNNRDLTSQAGSSSSEERSASTVDESLIPPDSRWEHPQYLTYRPADGDFVDVNPPRMSWPYVPQVVIGWHEQASWGTTIPFREFTLQFCSKGDFTDPEIEVATDYNYYNALPELESGKWYWRIQYSLKDQEETSELDQWSVVRTFIVREETPVWDRTVIHKAADILAARGHPRLGPEEGDWQRWRESLEADQRAGVMLEQLLNRAEQTINEPWWNDFPESDREGENPYSAGDWGTNIGPKLVDAVFAYQLTGDAKFEKAADHFLKIAGYPKGGFTSPEYFYSGPKWGTRVTVHLAMFYDSWHDRLSKAERENVLDAIEWRLKGIIQEKYSWKGENGVWSQGVAMYGVSHPFENFYYAAQAALLVAGDLEIGTKVLEQGLHYLTGVTSAFGPDEGWNEGMAYGVWKTSHPMDFKIMTAITLPQLQIQKNPMMRSLGKWHAHLLPLGIGRLPFGDSSAQDPSRFRQIHSTIFLRLAWLTEEPLFMLRRQVLEDLGYDGVSTSFPWPDMSLAERLDLPEPGDQEPATAHFPEAGWAMAASHGPSDIKGFQNGTGMIFQSRPRGGYSHSYRAENTFAWHALGHTLSSPGGSVLYRDPHSHHTMSHNGILINGKGQEWDEAPRQSRYPFAGRLLAYQEQDNYVHWVGDATYAYQTVDGLLRAHRHVLLIDDKWFAVFDDLAMREEADPARFSYLFHVVPDVEGELDSADARFRFSMPGGDEVTGTQSSGTPESFSGLFEKDPVEAEVALANEPNELDLENLQHQGSFRNLITGEDIYEEAMETQQRFNREPLAMAHNIWATNREPAHQWQFLSTYLARRSGEPRIEISFPSSDQVVATYPDGSQRHLSFDPDQRGDINIDPDIYREHAMNTDPNYLREKGQRESFTVDNDRYEVEWLYDESFDTAWMLRWIQEGDALVMVKDDELHQSKANQDHVTQSTVWFRPELPQNLALRIRVRVDETTENNAGNVNLILHAQEKDNSWLKFGRDGRYSEYHEIPNYIITLVGGDMEQGHNRLRRNPGFNLVVDNQDVRSHVGETYELLVTMENGRIRYYLDGEKTIDHVDENPLPAGRMGLRTWNSNVIWEQIEIGKVH